MTDGSSSNRCHDRSLGCELYYPLLDQMHSLQSEGLLSHVQISVPNILSAKQLKNSSNDLPVIFHSNLLNVLGKNDWPLLQNIAELLKTFHPVHVVEHFTLLRDGDLARYAVPPVEVLLSKAALQNAVDNVKRWQNILALPVSLENVPITREVEEYLDLLLEVKRKTGCSIACDIPHFYISSLAMDRTETELKHYAHELAPVQVHLSGVKILNGKIMDSHETYQPWLKSYLETYFGSPTYITLEQSPHVNSELVRSMLARLQKPAEHELIPNRFSQGLPPATNIETNKALAQASWSSIFRFPRSNELDQSLGLMSPYRAQYPLLHKSGALDPVGLLDSYYPFLFPVTEFARKVSVMSMREAVAAAARLANLAAGYASWLQNAEVPNFKISIGKGRSVVHVFESGDESTEFTPETSSSHTFHITADDWLRIEFSAVDMNPTYQPEERGFQ